MCPGLSRTCWTLEQKVWVPRNPSVPGKLGWLVTLILRRKPLYLISNDLNPLFMHLPPLGQEVILHVLLFLLLFSRSVVSGSLWPHGLQLTRLPCPSQSPRVCTNSCLLSRWCHPTILSSVAPFSSCPQYFPTSESFQWVVFSHQVAKVLELQLQQQSSNEYSGLISFRIGWFDPLAVQMILKSLL